MPGQGAGALENGGQVCSNCQRVIPADRPLDPGRLVSSPWTHALMQSLLRHYKLPPDMGVPLAAFRRVRDDIAKV